MKFRPAIIGFALLATPLVALEAAPIRAERLAERIVMLDGAGSNVVLSYGQDGNLLVDSGEAPLANDLAAAVASVDRAPVRFLINTHFHYDHVGANEHFARQGAMVIAQENLRLRLAAGTSGANGEDPIPPAAPAALPAVTFRDRMTLHNNGDEVEIIFVPHAHTDGDSLVHWRGANVLHMGDTYFRDTFPYIDVAAGGSIDGLIRAVETGEALANESTRIVPGHGAIATRQDLVRYGDMLKDIRSRVAAGIRAGNSLEQIKLSRPAASYGMINGHVPPDAFIEWVYAGLSAPSGRRP